MLHRRRRRRVRPLVPGALGRGGRRPLPGAGPPRRPHGVYFISYGPDGHAFSYYRAGSAASLVTAAEVPADLVASARVLHASGISQAISPSACDAVFHAIRLAKQAGALVSYDTNLRLALWPLDRARAVIHAAVALADIVRPGLDDARQLTGRETPDAICDHYLGFGVEIVALTLGPRNPGRHPRPPGAGPRAQGRSG